MGATYEYGLNLALQMGPAGKDDICAAGGQSAPQMPLALALQHSDEPPPKGPEQGKGEQLSYLLNGHCKATSGWQTFSGKIDFNAGDDLPGGPRGQTLVPAFDLQAVQAPGQVEAWVDNLLIVCK
jgi:hypothetical protein